MFKKSLYFQIVIIFIGVVLISLASAFFISSSFFHSEVIFDEELSNISSGVAEIVELTGADDLPQLMDTIKTYYFNAVIVSEGGEVIGENAKIVNEVSKPMIQHITSLNQGETYILPYEHKANYRIIGLPVSIVAGETHALFVFINYEEEFESLRKVVFFTLCLVLMIGSGLILLASRYLVNPVKKLTNAAREMAKGNFSVRMETKSTDEVGELISSFNHMASEVEKIDQMREDFVSSVSHEIQSPITSIRGFTKAIKDDVVPKQHQKEYLDIIYQETERLSRLSENLLRLASLDSEQHPYRPETYRIDEQLRRTVLATEPLWKEKSIYVSLELEKAEIYADQDLMEQVWFNLLTNAIKYTPKNGQVSIGSEREIRGLVVRIKDTGKGIPEESIPQLFDRFYKVDKARSSAIDGNGLGLSIVKKILAIHQYSIEVVSEEGLGSIFIVRLKDEKEAKTKGNH
ncbi:sensor histidine kinase [Alkalihalobacillus hemicellulosilyticus]|uniref:Heme sensor protein HssS n=1 Tax=Halalkalibacter hemicellulosilyticusJCM 9152 TaxID=1236971 RepID=W4QDT9_9BACI|nr:HAMP domain-containing sensor histidine kinase [Halalkalibacter hemicellulosilyticus]GAE29843.1 sensor histidine kinase [Halalkalibacter hemicellulosilyticusJCM 9152]